MASSTLYAIVFFATASLAFSFQTVRLRNVALAKARSACSVFPASARASAVSLRLAKESVIAVDPNDLAKLIDAGMPEAAELI